MSKRRGTNSRHGVVGRELQARDFTQQPCQAWFTPEDQEDDPGGLRGIFFFLRSSSWGMGEKRCHCSTLKYSFWNSGCRIKSRGCSMDGFRSWTIPRHRSYGPLKWERWLSGRGRLRPWRSRAGQPLQFSAQRPLLKRRGTQATRRWED